MHRHTHALPWCPCDEGHGREYTTGTEYGSSGYRSPGSRVASGQPILPHSRPTAMSAAAHEVSD